MHTTIMEKFLKKCKSSTEGRNLYFHQDNIHVYQKPIWALYTLSQYLHHFLCPRVLFMCRKIIKDYNEGFTLHQINNHWHWNKATISWILNCSTLVEVKSTKAGWGILQPPPPNLTSIKKKSFKTHFLCDKWFNQNNIDITSRASTSMQQAVCTFWIIIQ